MTNDPDICKAVAQRCDIPSSLVDRVVRLYGELAASISDEDFEWTAVSHMCGSGFSVHMYVAEGTKVTRQLETSARSRETVWGFARKAYRTFGEARRAELRAMSQPVGDGVVVELGAVE